MAKMPRTPGLRKPGRPKGPPDPTKAILKPQRLKPASTRNYGKGGTPLSAAGSDMGIRGAGIGYGGPDDGI